MKASEILQVARKSRACVDSHVTRAHSKSLLSEAQVFLAELLPRDNCNFSNFCSTSPSPMQRRVSHWFSSEVLLLLLVPFIPAFGKSQSQMYPVLMHTNGHSYEC